MQFFHDWKLGKHKNDILFAYYRPFANAQDDKKSRDNRLFANKFSSVKALASLFNNFFDYILSDIPAAQPNYKTLNVGFNFTLANGF